MEELLDQFFADVPALVLAGAIVLTILVLGKSADGLVDAAVALSLRSRMPKFVIGATVVSLGTTTPEAAVSVMAAVQGSPGLALGNAVGSIICDTGLILGLASLIAPLRLDRAIVNRQGWIQLGAGLALVAFTFPFSSPGSALRTGSTLPQVVGFVFLFALAAYIYLTIRWARTDRDAVDTGAGTGDVAENTIAILLKLGASLILVVVSATVLIHAVKEAALRLSVPEGVIAATLVAFGTSLPELVTAVKASMRGHGELAVGNVIGADILNVLFVAGAAAAVTPGGLIAGPQFFQVLFPAMVFVLLVFRIGVVVSGDAMRRPFGVVLLAAYAIAIIVGYLV